MGHVSLEIKNLSGYESAVAQFSSTVVGKLEAIVERKDGWLTMGWNLAEEISISSRE
jgi:hypothetical protein